MNVYPAKLAYHGVLIERPCANCDTVNIHFEGQCQSAPCAQCGVQRYLPLPERYHDWVAEHPWQPKSYVPQDIEQEVPGFIAILNAVREHGLPEMYTSDLFRDYQAIAGLGLYSGDGPATRFIWCVRDTGSDLITPGTDPSLAKRLIEVNTYHFTWDQTYLPGLGLLLCLPHDALLNYEQWRRQDAQRRRTDCHGPTWHNGDCVHRKVSVAPNGDHTHGPGVMACTLCSPDPNQQIVHR